MSSNTAQLTSHSLSQFCPSQVYTPVLLLTVTSLQNKTPKMTWQNPCWHSHFWCCKEDYLGRSGFKWKKKRQAKDDFMHRNRCSERGQERDSTLLRMPTIYTTRWAEFCSSAIQVSQQVLTALHLLQHKAHMPSFPRKSRPSSAQAG